MFLSFSPKNYQVDVIFFNKCNLNCNFCFEQRDSKINKTVIQNAPKIIVDYYREVFNKFKCNTFIQYLQGGELLSDDIDDEVFYLYRQYYDDIIDKLKEFPFIKNIKTVIVTNGIWKNKKRIENLLKYTNSKMTMSYDAYGRFRDKNDFELWKENYFHFNNYIDDVSTTLTKPNIRAYINGDNIFNIINKSTVFSDDVYLPTKEYKTLIPNDEDLYSYFSYIIDNKVYNSSTLQKIAYSYKYHCIDRCFNSYHIHYMNGKCYRDCIRISSYLSQDFYDIKSVEDSDEFVKLVNVIGHKKRRCLSCIYYDKCPKQCFVPIIFKDYSVSVCPIKRAIIKMEDTGVIDEILNRN